MSGSSGMDFNGDAGQAGEGVRVGRRGTSACCRRLLLLRCGVLVQLPAQVQRMHVDGCHVH
jgi:hypothetical protein